MFDQMNIADGYFVYILASKKHGTLYTGVTNDLRTRLELHRSGKGSKFVQKYGVTPLVYRREATNHGRLYGPVLA